MRRTPSGSRLHIGLVGRRNAGKSSILNAITGQQSAIVSPEPGTTTDPVHKPMELLPLGPVVLVDTPGLDDTGALGGQRVLRARAILSRIDAALLVAEAPSWGMLEQQLLDDLLDREVPTVVVLNKADTGAPRLAVIASLRRRGVPFVATEAPAGKGIEALQEALLAVVPEDWLEAPPLLADLVPDGGIAVLVVPVDAEAPRGRLILPQAQAVRDLLDHGRQALVTREHQLPAALARLDQPPSLVVTDSQAFGAVAAATPAAVPLTSFSILLSRQKGDLALQALGARSIDRLRPGDHVLIAEACTHHPVEDDIGTVKIPRWLDQRLGYPLSYQHVRGRDFPDDLGDTRLVIHCGACMWTRRAVLDRILRCRARGVPITNYGMAIAHLHGILERALEPFPAPPPGEFAAHRGDLGAAP